MRIVVTSGAGAGHWGPLAPVVAALRSRGDEVVVAVPEAGAAAAQASGATVVVLPGPDAGELARATQRFRSAPAALAGQIMNGEIFGRLNTRAALPTLIGLLHDRAPELVVHEAAEFAGAVAAEQCGIRHLQVAISAADVEAGSLAHAAPELDGMASGVAEQIRLSPYLTRFPAALDPSPYPVTRRYRTRVTAAESASRSGSAAWQGGSGRPLVYVTFGTVTASVTDDARLYRSVLAALAGLEVRVLVTTGRGHRPDLGPLDPYVQVSEWVDQDQVLSAAAVVVCHGGSGTVLGALAHGVPVVALPLFADQPVNAARVAAAGAGLVVTRPPTSAADAAHLTDGHQHSLRDAVTQALTDPALRHGAARIAAELRAAPDILDALDAREK